MLHDGGLVCARGRLRGGEVFGITGGCGTGGFAYVVILAWDVVVASACMIVHYAIEIVFFQFVFRVDKMFAQRASCFDCS